MVFLIILIVATAVLIAWLLVELARMALADFRFPRLRASSVQSAPTAGRALPAVGGTATERTAAERDAGNERREADTARSEREAEREERVLHDEADVEMAVRDRLYGRHGRRG